MEELTKEEQILKELSDNSTVDNKYLQEKFGVNENYLVSLRSRIKNGHIKLNNNVRTIQQDP